MTINLLTVMAVLVSMTSAQTTTTPPTGYEMLTQVSSDGDGAIFGLNQNGDIFAWNGREWNKIAGQLTQVSVGSKNDVWGVNSVNHSAWQLTTDKGWQARGQMLNVAVAKGGGAVVGVDSNGKAAQWDATKTAWVPFPSSPVLKQIGIGKVTRVYGLGVNGEIYRWRPLSKNWLRINGALSKLSIAADGTIGGVNSIGKGWRRSDADVEAEVAGSTTPPNWVPVDSQIKDIELVAADSSLLMLDQNVLIQDQTPVLVPPPQGYLIIDAPIVVATDIPRNSDGSLDIHYQVDDVPWNPALLLQPYDPSCVGYTLSGSISLFGNAPAKEFKTPVCNGTFQTVPPPSDSDRLAFISGSGILGQVFNPISLGSSTDYVARPPISSVCQSRHFPIVTNNVWVEFRLPVGRSDAAVIQFPAGGYHKASDSTCDGVGWDNLTFTCQQGLWQLTQGTYYKDQSCKLTVPDTSISAFIFHADR